MVNKNTNKKDTNQTHLHGHHSLLLFLMVTYDVNSEPIQQTMTKQFKSCIYVLTELTSSVGGHNNQYWK